MRRGLTLAPPAGLGAERLHERAPEKSERQEDEEIENRQDDVGLDPCRMAGKGRVFYTGLGHGPDVFSNPQFLAHLLAGIQYALGDLAADDAPDSIRTR